MIDISAWMDNFLNAIDATFGDRVWFVGLQGSYGRGEATEESDIDAVVILDDLSALDIEAYGVMLDSLPNREKVCGFLSGKAELLGWAPYDLFQFYYDTTPIRGSLDDLLPLLDGAAVDEAIKIGVCGIYHGCVHNMLHEKSVEILVGLYKSASFVLQAIAFRKTGRYVRRQHDLRELLSASDRGIADTFLSLKGGGTVDFFAMSEALFVWSKQWILQMRPGI